MAVRGIGTAYHVGWESTWLADNPEAVHTVLNTIYGHLPFCPPVPDVSAVAALAFDAQTASRSRRRTMASAPNVPACTRNSFFPALLVLKCTVGSQPAVVASASTLSLPTTVPFSRYPTLPLSEQPSSSTARIRSTAFPHTGMTSRQSSRLPSPAQETSTCWPTVPGTAQRVKFSPPSNPRSSTACFLPSTRPPLQKWRCTGP